MYLEESIKQFHYEKFEDWITNFALNLPQIWVEKSAKELAPISEFNFKKENPSAIVIGRGPSIDKHKHLEQLAQSEYKGTIVCCDGKLIDALKAGVKIGRAHV